MIQYNPNIGNYPSELHDGTYEAVIEKSEECKTRNGDGTMLKMMFCVTGPSNIGCPVFEHIILEHPSQGAEYYGHLKLGNLLKAAGLDGRTSFGAEELVGRRVKIQIRMKDDERWGLQPQIVAYMKPENASVPVSDDVEAEEEGENEDDIPI